MATSAEIQMLRNADPGAILPGIDTPTGNPDPASSLMSYTQITQNAKGSPYYYNPTNNIVYVTQAGAVLSGINFGSATLAIEANNVTVQDCTFTATTSFWTVDQTPGYSGATIEDCTFQGSGSPTENNVWINATQSITIKDNSFLDSPGDAIDIEGGVVTGNYFSGAGFLPGAHADAIQILAATGPTTITDNFIDGAWNPSAPANANSDIRIVTEGSNISNVNISGNYLLGGAYSLEVGPEPGTSYRFSNVAINNNYIGFSEFGPYYGAIQNYASLQGNTLVAYSNPASSAQALAAYEKTAILPAHVIAATAAGQVLTSAASTPTTLLGDSGTTFVGSTNETNFVSGYDAHVSLGGEGANIFT
ncbi:MAG: right-handed parallel beta-helix repeat-containing protein, partial [Roseiarcus sp.]|uniref:right-handed parallel beta-helix repeat-containing protein n=1 Tax=Roseiarcus sp. TaxID=1969460 RepID=UPI003C428522